MTDISIIESNPGDSKMNAFVKMGALACAAASLGMGLAGCGSGSASGSSTVTVAG